VILTSDTPLFCAVTEYPILPWVASGLGTWRSGQYCPCPAHDVMPADDSVRHLFRLEAK